MLNFLVCVLLVLLFKSGVRWGEVGGKSTSEGGRKMIMNDAGIVTVMPSQNLYLLFFLSRQGGIAFLPSLDKQFESYGTVSKS